jgi:hypothetical protein
MTPFRIDNALALALIFVAVVPSAAQAANPIDWIADKLHGATTADKSLPPPSAEALRDHGPVALKPGEAVRFHVGEEAPEAELPKGRSHFRRVEVEGSVPKAHVRVTVLAQDAKEGKGHTVFKPLLYVLDDEGNVKNTLEFSDLELDIRPFTRTRLNGCVAAEGLQRFLVATAEKSIGSHFETVSRDAVKAPTQSGFFYSSTESLKVKLPYSDTGELVLKVMPAASDKEPCGKPPAKDKKDEKPGTDASKKAPG